MQEHFSAALADNISTLGFNCNNDGSIVARVCRQNKYVGFFALQYVGRTLSMVKCGCGLPIIANLYMEFKKLSTRKQQMFMIFWSNFKAF